MRYSLFLLSFFVLFHLHLTSANTYEKAGTEPKIEFVDYKTAKQKVQEAGIKKVIQYKKWQKQHPDIPSNPDKFYKEWKSWPSFFGKKFVDYLTAQKRVQEAGIKKIIIYKEWQKQHPDIPSNPDKFYKEWKSWPSFFGKKFVDYETAQKRVQEAGIKKVIQYKKWQKRHPDIPSNPNITYKKWKSWPSFFGKEKTTTKKEGQKQHSNILHTKINHKNKSGKCLEIFKN